jgi:hypothetical protein
MCFQRGHINNTNHREAVLVSKSKKSGRGQGLPTFLSENLDFFIGFWTIKVGYLNSHPSRDGEGRFSK